MTTAAARPSGGALASASKLRVGLVAQRVDRAVLDGAWWPRSTDPDAELPDLIVLLRERFGPIRQVMLNSHAWDSHPRRLTVDGRTVRLGWFASVDPAVVIVTAEKGDQVDLLVVPADTADAAARHAMTRAADPSNVMRAPDILRAGNGQ